MDNPTNFITYNGMIVPKTILITTESMKATKEEFG